MTYPETLSQSLARLEPDSGWEGCAHDPKATPELRIALSQAISLRRIADFLAGSVSNCDAVAYLVGELGGRTR